MDFRCLAVGLSGWFLTCFVASVPVSAELEVGDQPPAGPKGVVPANAIAQAQAIIVDAHARFGSGLADRLQSDAALRQSYGGAHLLLGQVTQTAPIGSPARDSLYAFHRDLISGALSVDGSLFLKDRVFPESQNTFAWLREHFYTNWIASLPLTAQRVTEISDLGQFPARYRQIFSTHGVYLQDNTRLTARQFQVIDEMFSSVAPSLHNIAFLSVRDYLGGLPVDLPEAGDLTLIRSSELLRGRINVFLFEVGSFSENSFPADVSPGVVDTFSIVLVHEINHIVEIWTIDRDPALRARRDSLIAAAGRDPLNYLRSMFDPGFFASNPQEFFASISNQWFVDSEKVFELGLLRFDSGRPQPLNQALLFAEVYSQGSGQTVFYTLDTNGQITSARAVVGRDQNGHIDGIIFGSTCYAFERDAAGNALSYATAARPGAPGNLRVTAVGPNEVELIWNDNSASEELFEIERRAGEGSFEPIASVGANVTSFRDTMLAGSNTYSYRIRARAAACDSDVSETVSITLAVERAPSDLTATTLSAKQIRLSWRDNATSESGYQVELKKDGDDFNLFQTLPADAHGTIVDGLEESTTYTFRVRAIGGTGDSPYSNQASATTFAEPGPCVPGPNTLCLGGGRFKAEVDWRNFRGRVGSAFDTGLVSADSGLFYFFDSDNWEMLIKVLDGCRATDHFWVFAAATTNVEYTLTVTDTVTGVVQRYTNPLGVASSAITDTRAFATCSVPAVPFESRTMLPRKLSNVPSAMPIQGDCISGENSLCLNQNRFRVEVDWKTAARSGQGQVDAFQSSDSGLFWFFAPNNLEMLVKVLDGCAFNDRIWVFAAATTNVEYILRVVDTETGAERLYFNPAGNAAAAITDTDAFVACP